MISISLKDFKNIEDTKTYRFSKNNLIHLTGTSGAGKSTILCAFEWCLYGKMNGVKPRSRKDAIPVVEISLDNLTISRNGNTLTVITDKQKTLQADAAQGYIYSVFGERDLWKSCSYLEQGYRNNFLIASSEDKLKILRDLAYGYSIDDRDNPEFYINIMQEEIKKTKDIKRDLDAIYENFYNETEISINKYHDSDNQWEECDYDIEELKDIIKQKTEEYKSLSAKYNIEKDLKRRLEELNKRFKEIKKNDTFSETNYSKEKDNCIKELESLKNKLVDIELYIKLKDLIPYEIDNTGMLENLLLKNAKYESFKEQLIKNKLPLDTTKQDILDHIEKVKLFKLYEEFKDLEEKEEFISSMKKYITSIIKKKDKLMLEKESLGITQDISSLMLNKAECEKRIKDYKSKKFYKCPSCESKLFIDHNDSLSYYKDTNISGISYRLDKINEEITLLNKLEKLFSDLDLSTRELKEAEEKFDKSRFDLLKKKDFKSVSGYLPTELKSLQSLEFLLDKYSEKIDQNLIKKYQNGDKISKLLGSKIDVFLKNPDSFFINEDSKSIKNKIISLEEKLKELEKNKQDKIKLDSEKEFLSKEIHKISSKIKDIVNLETLEEIEKELEYLRMLEIDYIKYTEMTERLDLLNSHEKKRDNINNKLSLLETLYEHIKKLSIEPLENLIQTINYKVNEYLEKLFIDSSIQVIISLFKQKGTKRDSFNKIIVNMQIYHNKNEYTNINSLSGGEADRISLALTLVFAELHKTPILFLDECMASLDSDLREICLSLIKDSSSKDMIVVDICHESVEGYHDCIINVTN